MKSKIITFWIINHIHGSARNPLKSQWDLYCFVYFFVLLHRQRIYNQGDISAFQIESIREKTLRPFSRFGWVGGFKGKKCTCPLATCEKLYRGASSPSLLFIKCVKAKRLLNGNALKQIGLTGSNSPVSLSQERTDGSCLCHVRALISLYQAEYNWIW